MRYAIVVASCALFMIAFSAAAQKTQDSTSQHNTAAPDKTPKCPDINISLPHKTFQNEEKNLSKDFKWDKVCVEKSIKLFNESVEDLSKKLEKVPCDPKLTQQEAEYRLKEYQHSYDLLMPHNCRRPPKPI